MGSWVAGPRLWDGDLQDAFLIRLVPDHEKSVLPDFALRIFGRKASGPHPPSPVLPFPYMKNGRFSAFALSILMMA
jgi:hypothetical protein